MKKIIAILLAAALTVSVATAAFAATNDGAYNTGDVNLASVLMFKLSKNVFLAYKAAADKTGYSIGTYHNKGTKTFASSSGDSKIFEAAITAKTIPAAPVGTASAAFGTGWTSL